MAGKRRMKGKRNGPAWQREGKKRWRSTTPPAARVVRRREAASLGFFASLGAALDRALGLGK